MHNWLFENHGVFRTTQELAAGLSQFGWNVDEFVQEMSRDPWVDPNHPDVVYPNRKYVEIVRADAQEGIDLGLFYTPMMFVNGVQIRGFRTPNVLTRAVEALERQNPPPGEATQDWPSSKRDKYIGDYFSNAVTVRYGDLGRDGFRAVEGPADAPVEIQTFMSYRSSFAADLQKTVDECMARHPGKVRVVYRHYPVTKAANPKVLAGYDDGDITYTMAKAVEAVGQLKGAEAFVKMHRWTLAHQDDWKLDDFVAQAQTLGIDPTELRAKIESPLVQQAIQSDVEWLTRARLGAKAAVFINNKHVYNWNTDNLPIVQGIVDQIIETSK
jgi:protein-disulfide isomerase